MAVIDELKILVTAEVSKAIADLDKTTKATDAAEKSASGMGATFGKMRDVMQGPIEAMQTGMRVVSDLWRTASELMGEWAEKEKSLARFSTTMETIGNMGPAATSQLSAFAEQISKVTGIDDDDVRNMESFLAAAGRSKDEIEKILMTSVDMAAGTGQDVQTVLEQISATYSGTIGRLGKLAPELKTLDEAMLVSGKAVDVLAGKYKGLNQGLVDTTDVTMKNLQNSWKDTTATIGRTVSDVLGPAIKAFTDGLDVINAAADRANKAKKLGELIDSYLKMKVNPATFADDLKKIGASWDDFADAMDRKQVDLNLEAGRTMRLVDPAKILQIQQMRMRMLDEKRKTPLSAIANSFQVGASMEGADFIGAGESAEKIGRQIESMVPKARRLADATGDLKGEMAGVAGAARLTNAELATIALEFGAIVGIDFGPLTDELLDLPSKFTPTQEAIISIGTLAESAFGAFEMASDRAYDVAVDNLEAQIDKQRDLNETTLDGIKAEQDRHLASHTARMTQLEDQIKEIEDNGGDASAIEAELAAEKADYATDEREFPGKRLEAETNGNTALKKLEEDLAKVKEDKAKEAFNNQKRITAAQMAIDAVAAGLSVTKATGNPIIGAAVGAAGLGLAAWAGSLDYNTGQASWSGLMDTFGLSNNANPSRPETVEAWTAYAKDLERNAAETEGSTAAGYTSQAGKAWEHVQYLQSLTPAQLMDLQNQYLLSQIPGASDIANTSAAWYAFADKLDTEYHSGWADLARVHGYALNDSGLAEGGIVTSPQYRLIGEAGPEAVIPLSKATGMLSGGNITIHVHGSLIRERELDGIVGRALAKASRGY